MPFRRFFVFACLGATVLAPASALASDDRFLLQTAPPSLAAVLARHQLEVEISEPGRNLHRVRDVSGRSTDDVVRALQNDPEVLGVELDGAHVVDESAAGIHLEQSTAAILEAVRERAAATYFGTTVLNRYADQPATRLIGLGPAHARATGSVIVAIIDTGIDPDHPALRNRLVPGYDFLRDRAGIPDELGDLDQSTAAILEQSTAAILEQDQVTVLNQSTAAILEQSTAAILETRQLPAAFGHGTMVAGLVHLVAPTARLMPLKAFAADGSSRLYDIVRAVYYAVDHGARVINMSFSMTSESKELLRAIGYANDRGVVVVSSVGNRGASVTVYPAASSKVLGTASTTDSDRRSSFSNYGKDSVTLTAPGESLVTTYPGAHFAAVWGTSFSAALVSGGAALLSRDVPAAQADLDGDIAVEAIRHARRLSDELGKGRLDLVAAFLARDQYDAQIGSGLPLGDDADGDGLPSAYEIAFGLDTSRHDAGADPDGDGLSNAQEYARGLHPRGFVRTLFAEGAASPFFATQFACANPEPVPVRTLFQFQRSDGAVRTLPLTLPARSRRTVDAQTVAGLAPAEFSTIIESDGPLACDRSMSWGEGSYGRHTESGGIAAGTQTWYLAEGSTLAGFQLFYLLQNPSDVPTTADVTFLRPAPAPPVLRSYALAPHSRTTVWVNAIPELAATDMSGIVRSRDAVAIVVERAMYLDAGGRTFKAGHEGAGITSPATTWHLAEGATGPFFDTFVLVANPDTRAALLEATFRLPSGETIVKSLTLPGESRTTLWVDALDARLSDTAVSTTITSLNGVPVVVERAMWWPGAPGTWQEAHASAGTSSGAVAWAIGEGEQAGASGFDTYLLVANLSARAGQVVVTLLFEDGPPASRTFSVAASSRLTVAAGEFPEARGKRFGALVESVGDNPASIVVEHAVYGGTPAQPWTFGSDALAVRLR